MIPTFVITLREGVEASLIIGIIAAFLVKEGRRDAMRQMWLGIGVAVALWLWGAVLLEVGGDRDRGGALHRLRRPARSRRPAAAAEAAGGPGDGRRPDRRHRGQLHD